MTGGQCDTVSRRRIYFDPEAPPIEGPSMPSARLTSSITTNYATSRPRRAAILSPVACAAMLLSFCAASALAQEKNPPAASPSAETAPAPKVICEDPQSIVTEPQPQASQTQSAARQSPAQEQLPTVTLKHRPAGANAPAQSQSAAPPQTIPLTVANGTPIQV